MNNISRFFRLLTAFAFIAGSFTHSRAQTAILWQKSLGGTNMDEAHCIRQTFDGGYIVAGYSFSADGDVTGHHGTGMNGDAWITKLDSNGNLEWERSFGGSGGDGISEIEQTTDSGYIMVGSTTSNDGDLLTLQAQGNSGYPDIWVVKLNDTGGIQWQQIWNNGSGEQGYSVQQTRDGGYAVLGTIYSDGDSVHGFYDYGLMKLNDTGGIEWKNVYGGHNCENAASVRQTSDGGFIVAGASNSHDGDVTVPTDNYDYWVLKLDSLGAIQWQKALGTGDDEGDCFNSKIAQIRQCHDSGYILSGYTSNDCYVAKTDDTGALQWQKVLGSTQIDRATSIEPTADGGYIMAAYASDSGGDVQGNYHDGYDYWVVKFNSLGLIESSQCLGGAQLDKAYSVQQVNDGSYIVAGSAGSQDGDVTGNHGDQDFWIVKLDKHLLSVPMPDGEYNVSIYPNPSKDIVRIEFSSAHLPQEYSVIDIRGQRQLQGTFDRAKQNLYVGGLAPGVYFLQVNNRRFKLVKI